MVYIVDDVGVNIAAIWFAFFKPLGHNPSPSFHSSSAVSCCSVVLRERGERVEERAEELPSPLRCSPIIIGVLYLQTFLHTLEPARNFLQKHRLWYLRTFSHRLILISRLNPNKIAISNHISYQIYIHALFIHDFLHYLIIIV